jgi:outer membrane protein OmpA-like peptidoglycan-associated protein
MFRSSKACAALTAGALVALGSVAAQPGIAVAADPVAPVAPVQTIVAPVIDMVAPVTDLQFGESDIRREVRVEQQPKRTTITLDSTILFGKDSAKLTARARGRLAEVAGRLKKRGPGSVTVTGYTDDLGSAAYGKTLSRKRANAVAGELRRDLTGSAFPFRIEGRGEANPAVPNKNEASRRINRRVVVVYQRR